MKNLKNKSVRFLVLVSVVLLSCLPLSAEVRFVVTGDTRGDDDGVNTTILGEIADAVIAEEADFILFTGDLTNDGTVLQLTTWRNTMQDVYDAGIGVYPCRGNHDVGTKADWDCVFTGAYALPNNGPAGEENITFSFTQDNVFIVGLDQYVTDARINQTWLDAQFAANDQPHVFVFGHEPAFSVHHSDCLDEYPTDRNTFWNSIATEGGRTYFCGHDHFYNHTRLDDGDPNDNVHQYIVATGGAPLYDWDNNYGGDNGSWTPQLVHHEKEYGYVLVEIDGLNVTLTWKHRESPGVYQTNGDTFAYSTQQVVDWVAYNDMAWGTSQLDANITTITSPDDGTPGLPSDGNLVDYSTGAATNVTLTVTGGKFVVANATQGSEPGSGTDAYNYFNGKVSSLGAISYNDTVSPAGDLVLTLTGMNPDRTYNLVFYGNRDSYAWDRASLVTISGADDFTNESSIGLDNNSDPLFTDTSDDSTRLPAENTTTGYVARFAQVDPGSDGQVVLTISYDGTVAYRGKYASALMVEQSGPPLPAPASFEAYVDLRAQSGDNNHSNVLCIVPSSTYPDYVPPAIDPATDWVLKDLDTGADLPVTMNVNMQIQFPTTNGADSAGGTDAYNIFGGIVDGVGGYEIVDTSGDYVTVTFNNLEADAEYEVSLTHNRNSTSYTDRASRCTITGADTYTNAGSTGVVVNGPNSVSFSTGNNGANGYVAGWTGITDADGSFSVTTVQDTAWAGSKGYAMTSVLLEKIEQIEEPNEWVAYNDSQPQDSTNDANVVTEHDYNASDALLKDYNTGNDLSATVTGITVNGYDPVGTGGAVTNTSSDAYQTFNGIVDLIGSAELDAATWDNIIEFNDLDPNMEYTITLTANRASVSYANQRFTRVTIEGADTYANAGSTGVIVNGADSVSFSTGYNTINGYVAKWTSVTTGPDGSFSIKSEYDDSQAGTKGYAMSAFKLEQSVPESAATLPILVGDTWKYFKGASEPPANWADANFNDSSWLQGPTGIGYADSDDATVLSDMQNNYMSVYARKGFNVPDPNAIYRLLFSMDYDDGFVAYLNGTEIARANVTGNPPDYNTPADADHEASGSSSNPVEYFEIDEALLEAGVNVLAFQGHNKSISSSDFSMLPALEDVDYNWISYINLNAKNLLDQTDPAALRLNPEDIDYTSTAYILKDYDMDVNLPVTISIDMDIRYSTDNGANCDIGTDSDNLFGAIIDISGGIEIDEPNGHYLTTTFDNLNPDKKYTIALTYNRGNSGYTDRASKFTITGADSYTNASSSGVVINDANSVSFVTGYNTVNGYVAMWEDVTADDGSFSVTAVHDTAWAGTKAYTMTAIMLLELDLDSDGDGIPDDQDNCPDLSNPDQNDVDGDGVGDLCDNCPDVNNPDQANSDTDSFGDLCDNCPDVNNPDQNDVDGDDVGNLCDNCPDVNNPGQANSDTDSFGDLCDNCPTVNNPDQNDVDVDGVGNLCDNCPDVNNPDQNDVDTDNVGDLCDNCPVIPNEDQNDTDIDGIGDECECEQANLDDIDPVNFMDLSILVENWLGTAAIADTNWDGIVDIADLAQVCEHWLEPCGG